MRITNSMMIDTFLVNLNGNLSRMNKYEQQLATQRRITRLSDDSVGVLNSMNARQRLFSIGQYQENLVSARSWVEQNDSVFQEMSNLISEIKKNVIDAATDAKTPEDKANIAKLVAQYTDHIMDTIGNTTVGGKFIFGGFNTTKKPFIREPDDPITGAKGKVLYNGVDLSDYDPNDPLNPNNALVDKEAAEKFQFEVGFELKLDVTVTGVALFGTGQNNMLKILDDVTAALERGESASVLTQHLGKLDIAMEKALSLIVGVGAKETKIDTLENRYSTDELAFTKIMSDVEDIDASEVIMQFRMAEAVYRQALSAGARIIMPTLMDFLR